MSTELLALRTVRAPWVAVAALLAVAGAILGLNAALLGSSGQPAATPSVLADLVAAPGRLTGAVALLLGLLLSTSEYRHSTALATRLAEPRVRRLVAGKAAAAALAGALLGVAVVAVMLAGGAAALGTRDVAVQPWEHGLPAAAGALVIVAALHGVIGVGVGELLRNQAAAVGVVLGWAFVVEGVLPVVLREPTLTRWLPGGAIQSALEPTWRGLALLAAYAAGLALLGSLRARADA